MVFLIFSKLFAKKIPVVLISFILHKLCRCQIFVYKIEQLVNGFCLGDVFLYALLAFVQGYLAACSSDVAVISVCHFAWAIDNTSHDTNLETFVSRILLRALVDGFLDAAYCVL